MIIPTYVLIILLLIFILFLQLNLLEDTLSDKSKLENIQKINILLVVTVLCYICVFIGKVVL